MLLVAAVLGTVPGHVVTGLLVAVAVLGLQLSCDPPGALADPTVCSPVRSFRGHVRMSAMS